MALRHIPYVEIKAMRLACAIHTLHYEVIHEPPYKHSHILVRFYRPRRCQSVNVQLSAIQVFPPASITPRLHHLT